MFESAVSPVVRLAAVAEPGPTGRVLARALALPPGPESIRLLAQVDVARLDDVQRVEHLQAWERAARWVAASQQEAVVAVAGPSARDTDDFAREHVRVALLDCGGSPRADVDLARQLVGPLRAALEALRAGRISFAHARALARETEELTDQAAADVAQRVLPRAERRSTAEFRRVVRRAVLAADPAAADRRAAHAADDRLVDKRVDAGGRAALLVEGPTTAVAAMWTAIDALADRVEPGDTRTRAQRRFDAAVEVLTAAPGRADRPVRRGARPVVHLYADLPTWAGLADNPVEIEGFGVVPAGPAREAFTDARWRAVVVDTLTGLVRGVGDATYLPGARTRRHLAVRDRGCLFPGCPAPVERCDADHAVPFAQGGPTEPGNLGLLCRRHHRLKTFGGWRWERARDGTIEWRDVDGRAWRAEPVRYRVPPDARAAIPGPAVVPDRLPEGNLGP